MSDQNYDGDNFENSLYEDIYNEKHFFDSDKEFDDIDKYEQDYLLSNTLSSYERMKKFSKFLSYIFINNLKYKNYYEKR